MVGTQHMSETTYVVEKQLDRMGREKVVYAGQDADEAKRLADDLRIPRDTADGPRETFIHVWRGGEHQYVTREHPENHD